MSYVAALDHLYALGHELAPTASRRKFDLAHMRALVSALGDPQTAFPSILIAGTNGKGSTAATLSSILTAAGYRTALYTSPHLVRVNERIQIDGRPIPDDDFARLYFQVDSTASRLIAEHRLPHPPSFFEVLTAVAFLYFAECKIDIAILEVGLGGRLDATNIVDPLLSILTDIALDHQDYLGTTIAEITREKAGILRPHGALITLPQHPEANQAIGEAATKLHIRAISAANFIPGLANAAPRDPGSPSAAESGKAPRTPAAPIGQLERPLLPPNHYTVLLDQDPIEVQSPLAGHHQQRNIALAIAAAIELRNSTSDIFTNKSDRISYNITNANIAEGIRLTQWPGRLERISLPGGPSLLLDVAHNPAGAWSLRAAIAQLPDAQPRTLLFSCLRDKNLKEIAQILFPLFDASAGDPRRQHDHILFAPIDNPRASTLEDLVAAARALDISAHAAPHLTAALAQARDLTPPHGLIVATGSIYLVGAVRTLALSAPALANPASSDTVTPAPAPPKGRPL